MDARFTDWAKALTADELVELAFFLKDTKKLDDVLGVLHKNQFEENLKMDLKKVANSDLLLYDTSCPFVALEIARREKLATDAIRVFTRFKEKRQGRTLNSIDIRYVQTYIYDLPSEYVVELFGELRGIPTPLDVGHLNSSEDQMRFEDTLPGVCALLAFDLDGVFRAQVDISMEILFGDIETIDLGKMNKNGWRNIARLTYAMKRLHEMLEGKSTLPDAETTPLFLFVNGFMAAAKKNILKNSMSGTIDRWDLGLLKKYLLV